MINQGKYMVLSYLYTILLDLQSRRAKGRISLISATNFFETKLSPETDSAGLKTSKTAFNLIFP